MTEIRTVYKPAAVSIFTVSAFRDQTSVDHRLLIETRAEPGLIDKAVSRGAKMDIIPCPYDGLRNGYPMLVSAIEEVHNNKQAVLDGLGYVNLMYFRQKSNQKPPGVVTADQLMGLCETAFGAALYSFHRADNPYQTEGQFPDDFAALVKSVRGIQQGAMHYAALPGNNGRTPVDIERFLMAAERDEVFHGAGTVKYGPDGFVCAAPIHTIRATMAALMFRTDSVPEQGRLREYIKDPQKVMRFVQVYSKFNELNSQFRALQDIFYQHLQAVPQVMLRQGARHELSVYEIAEAKYLQKLALLQTRMNEALGRDSRMGEVTIRDVDGYYENSPRNILRRLGL
jgi:hypothetical protein